MKRGVLFAIAIGLLTLGTSCSKTKEYSALDPSIVEKELRAMEIGHRTAVDAKDIDGILRYYASDLITISPGETILYGKEWIRANLADLYKTYDFHEDFKFIDIKIIGDRTAASFSFTQLMTPSVGGEKIEHTGKGMCILKRSELKNWQFEWNSYYVDNTNPPNKK